MDKKDVIVESVKKLLALDLSPSEIIENLREVGIEAEEAKEIIAMAKGEPLEKKEEDKVKKEPGTALRRVAEDLASQQKEKPAKPSKTKHKAPPIKAAEERPPIPRAPAPTPPSSSSTLSKLWEKGILTTVNQRLNDMKQLRDDIDKTIDKKTREIAEAEIKKAEVLLESKGKLLTENVNHRLESKETEINQTIDLKIGELKALSKDLESKLKDFRTEERKLDKMSADFEAREAELKQLKTTLVKEMNSELLKSKSQAQETLDEAKKKVEDIDERVEKTLQLEQEVIDGIMRDAQDRIEAMKDESKLAMREELEEEIQKFEEIRKEFSPEKIRERVKDITELQEELGDKVEELLDARMKEKEEEMSKQIAIKTKSFAEIQKEYAKTSLMINKLQQDVQENQEKVNAFLARADKQISDNLQVQSSAVESLIQDTHKEFGGIKEQFTPDKIEKVQAASYDIQELKKLREDLEHLKGELASKPGPMQAGLPQVKDMDRLESVLTERLDSMVSQQFTNRESAFNDRLQENMREMETLKEKLENEIKQNINYEKLKGQSQELEIFKEQFINVIDRNINKFNEKIKKFNETAKAMEDQFNLRLQNIDRKIEELDTFEKSFAKEMGIILDEISKKKK